LITSPFAFCVKSNSGDVDGPIQFTTFGSSGKTKRSGFENDLFSIPGPIFPNEIRAGARREVDRH
jgi:hypothetical protein